MEDLLNRRVEAHALYMTEMLARLGFTPGDLEKHSSSEAAALAQARCETCRASHACGIWLDMRQDRPPIDIAQVPFFCPNREYLASVCASKKD
ncbi:MAG TPA: DUF6455 family protein [Saliniramus sp.]|nr:DUF6455 family protein [Saliniramus sp.]